MIDFVRCCLLGTFLILFLVSPDAVFGQVKLSEAGKFNTGMSYGLCLNNGLVYITTNSSLIIVDVKIPERPAKAGELNIGAPIFGLSVRDNLAFLAASDRGLVIADISDPMNIQIKGEYNGGGTMYNAAVEKNLCYTINYETGLEIFEIGRPENPKKIGSFWLTPRGFSIVDRVAFVSDPENGLTVLDISNPEKIKKLLIVEETRGAGGVRIHHELLFLGSFDNWIKIYDISEPQSPILIARYSYPYEVSGFSVTDRYLVTNFRGIRLQDISDIENPRSYSEYRARGLKGMAHGIVVQDPYIYYVKKGLTVLKIEKD